MYAYNKPIKAMEPPNVQDHYIGIDVGTGSARACIIDETGDIKALASENIKLWQPENGYYEQSTTDIWKCICECVRRVVQESLVNPSQIKGIGFDATCSLAVFANDTDEPIPVTGPKFDNDGNDRNVILWLDHRPVEETDKINATGHKLLKYVGGKMSIEMEIPKVLWLKNNMPPELFDRCKFYDLADALTHLATGNETRSFCSTVCKQGFVPVGVDGSVKGWQEDFYHEIGLGDLVKDDFKRMGGVDGVSGKYASAGECVGTLSRLAASQLGLPEGIAVGSGVIDAYAGWIGTVGAKVELTEEELKTDVPHNDVTQAFTRLAAVAGTSTCHLAMSKNPVFVPGVWGPYRDVLIPEFWMAEGGQSATGELLRHMLDIHPAYNETMALAKAEDKHIYDFLNAHLEYLAEKHNAPAISYLGRHHFFYGDLWGNRSPIADAKMRGSMIGLDSDKSTDNMALCEAISLEIGEDPMRLMPVKPRGGAQETEQGGSLSLAAIDDPVELAKTMMTMYERDAMFYRNIQDQNKIACRVLLEMSAIKSLVEASQWAQCLDKIRGLDILPLEAGGDASTIRAYASKFSSLSQPVSINVSNLIMWTIISCVRQREQLVNGQFSGNEGTRRMMVEQLKQMILDLTTYTSQLRYRFPPHLHEALARASAE
ncbi:FGGY-family pentulose kinase [Trichoderma guizhouense]|uniref:Nuclear pore protein n=1 Tax=Trichoderma guizhouense TaxID=1491466 RepID=A0A1T3CF71_9HYPO|nr:FGGY-family pentulose kinase [Trichoderma guizhouense]